ncbi:MAG: 3-oxo-tetronate kinase [Tagaea sp.]
MKLGAIADDLTGATDLASILRREGWRVALNVGVPAKGASFPGVDAVVIALKSRTVPVADAVAWSLASAEALDAAGAEQLFFKYCSTFDSTDQGNIGPVAEALMGRFGVDFTIACPAFPANGRTIYRGHLFVLDRLLAESPMKDHPLTPMRDSDLVRMLGRQTKRKVGLVGYETVEGGATKIRAAFDAARNAGTAMAIVDALDDTHLTAIGAACKGMRLVTGGSAVAMGLPANFAKSEALAASPFAAAPGGMGIVSGSCSAATRGQVASALASGIPALKLDPAALPGPDTVRAWISAQVMDRPVLVYSTAEPDAVRAAQSQDSLIAERLEDVLAEAARVCVELGRTRLVIAGGETSGAVVAKLGVACLEIGPEICPGVPWTRALDGRGLALALKSGNFGGPDFFRQAFEALR